MTTPPFDMTESVLMAIALVYRRVSTGEQKRSGYSLDDQLAECLKRAQELGATEIIDIEDDLGGDYLERPQFQKVLELCESGRVRWLICFDPDRFSRKLINQQLAVQAIERAGVEIVFVSHDYENTPEGTMFLQMRGVVAEFEKAKILDRTRRGKRNKLKQGQMPGWFDPYGLTLNEETDLMTLDESQARWVLQMYEWAGDPDPASRMSIAQIADRLNKDGVRAPRGTYWYRSTVRDILRNPLYTGVLNWGRYSHAGVWQARRAGIDPKLRPKAEARPESEWHRLTVPAIVSVELWQRVQEFLDVDKNRRSPKRTYMLTGLVRCGRCGSSVGHKSPPSGRWYLCNNRYPHPQMSPERRENGPRCDLPHIRAEQVEQWVWDEVCQLIRAPEAFEEYLRGKRSVEPTNPTQVELERVDAELEANQRSQERLLAFVMRTGANQSAAAENQMKELVDQAERLQRRCTELQGRMSVAQQDRTRVEQVAITLDALRDQLGARLELLTEERRTELVRRLVARVHLGGKESTEWRLSLIGLAQK